MRWSRRGLTLLHQGCLWKRRKRRRVMKDGEERVREGKEEEEEEEDYKEGRGRGGGGERKEE